MNTRTFALTEADHLAAQKLGWRSNIGVRRFRVGVVVVMGLFVLCVTLGVPSGSAALDAMILLYAGMAGSLGLVMLWRIARGFPKTWAKTFHQQKSLRRSKDFSWSDETFRFDWASGHAVTEWRDLVGWKEDASTLLLIYSDVQIDILPKRCFDEQALAELRERLAAAGVARLWPKKDLKKDQ